MVAIVLVYFAGMWMGWGNSTFTVPSWAALLGALGLLFLAYYLSEARGGD